VAQWIKDNLSLSWFHPRETFKGTILKDLKEVKSSVHLEAFLKEKPSGVNFKFFNVISPHFKIIKKNYSATATTRLKLAFRCK
jgi:hypothetical protein